MGVFERTRAWAGAGKTTQRLRQRRYELFVETCRVTPGETILDVGAGGGAALERFNTTNPIVAVDLAPRDVAGSYLDSPNVTFAVADGTSLPYADHQFPIVFSNSVIEHIPKELQAAFAAEIRRVGRRYFVQTPNRYFPIEPHYQFPLFQFLPKSAQKWLNAHVTLGWREKGHWEDVNLLSADELSRLFPDAEIRRERVFGLTKSLMAIRRA
jgi:2-polyprenyl-3-methyl-5-hydroxy-6-metoxy-1,4-benzoquinol methylase